MTYFSLVLVHDLRLSFLGDSRHQVPFEGGFVSEVIPRDLDVWAQSSVARRWFDFVQSDAGRNCLFVSDQVRRLIESLGFTGVDFHRATIRRFDVPRLLQQQEIPIYWACRVHGHVRCVEINDECSRQDPYALDATGLQFVVSRRPNGQRAEHLFTGRPLIDERTTPDFVEPAPMRQWTTLVSEQVADAFTKAKLTGYKLNPLQPGGRCWL